jgi:hypothetical protein
MGSYLSRDVFKFWKKKGSSAKGQASLDIKLRIQFQPMLSRRVMATPFLLHKISLESRRSLRRGVSGVHSSPRTVTLLPMVPRIVRRLEGPMFRSCSRNSPVARSTCLSPLPYLEYPLFNILSGSITKFGVYQATIGYIKLSSQSQKRPLMPNISRRRLIRTNCGYLSLLKTIYPSEAMFRHLIQQGQLPPGDNINGFDVSRWG